MTRATFLIIERALEPAPPLDSEPYWCYANTLIFHQKKIKVWEQEIPEAKMLWGPNKRWNCDEFEKYFGCEVFKDNQNGWQLRLTISHDRAEFWLNEIINWRKQYHNNHFKKETILEKLK